MWSACCGTRWPRLFLRWRAAGQRKWRPGLIGDVLAIGAGALICSISWELAADGFQLSSPCRWCWGRVSGPTARRGIGRRLGRLDWRQRRLAAGAGRTSPGIPEQLVLAIGVLKARGVSVALLVAIWSRTCPSDRLVCRHEGSPRTAAHDRRPVTCSGRVLRAGVGGYARSSV
jgi:hypothetical protein